MRNPKRRFEADCLAALAWLAVLSWPWLTSCSPSFKGDDGTGASSGTGGGSGGTSSTTGGTSAGGGGAQGGSGGSLEGGTGGGAPRGGSAGSDPAGGSSGTEPEGGAGGTGPVTPSYRDTILGAHPLVYWRMGITSGRIVTDQTGGGNDLVLQGTGHELAVEGAIGDDDDGAIGFDGAASFAIATDARALDFSDGAPFSIECWARRSTGGASYFQQLIADMDGIPGNRNGYALYLLPEPGGQDYAHTAFEYNRPAAEVGLSGFLAEEATWAHYVVTFDGASATLYVNGTLTHARPIGGGFAARTVPFAVARSSSDAGYFKGAVDEVAVYARALTVGEVAEHFDFAR